MKKKKNAKNCVAAATQEQEILAKSVKLTLDIMLCPFHIWYIFCVNLLIERDTHVLKSSVNYF